MTPLECLQYLMDCTGDVEGEEADPELRSACAEIKCILQFYPVFLKDQDAIMAAERLAISMLPLAGAIKNASRDDLESCLKRYGDMETTVRDLIKTILHFIDDSDEE